MSRTLALIGCGSAKRDDASTAKDLYTSSYATLKWRFGEQHGDDQRILSAEHGVVKPETVLEPYDATLKSGMDAYIGDEAVVEWGESVSADLASLLASDEFNEVVVLASQDYIEPIRDALEAADVRVRYPFEGRGLFEQMGWLSDQTSEEGDR